MTFCEYPSLVKSQMSIHFHELRDHMCDGLARLSEHLTKGWNAIFCHLHHENVTQRMTKTRWRDYLSDLACS